MVGRMFFAEQCEGSDKVNTWREGILGSEDRCFTSEKYHNNNTVNKFSSSSSTFLSSPPVRLWISHRVLLLIIVNQQGDWQG